MSASDFRSTLWRENHVEGGYFAPRAHECPNIKFPASLDTAWEDFLPQFRGTLRFLQKCQKWTHDWLMKGRYSSYIGSVLHHLSRCGSCRKSCNLGGAANLSAIVAVSCLPTGGASAEDSRWQSEGEAEITRPRYESSPNDLLKGFRAPKILANTTLIRFIACGSLP